MAIAVEYANASWLPQWQQPPELVWNHERFAAAASASEPTESPIIIPLVFEAKFRGHGSMEGWSWMINGKSYPDTQRRAAQTRSSATSCSSSTRASTIIPCIYTAAVSSCAVLAHHLPLARTLRAEAPAASSMMSCWSPPRPRPKLSSPPTALAPPCFTATSRVTWIRVS